MPKLTSRQRKLFRLSRDVAMFIVGETYSGEGDAQRLLLEAAEKIDVAAKLLKETVS